jgi:hypothetical protein
VNIETEITNIKLKTLNIELKAANIGLKTVNIETETVHIERMSAKLLLVFFITQASHLNFYHFFSICSLTFAPAGFTRPAPVELPQGRNAARVDGCSGAM